MRKCAFLTLTVVCLEAVLARADVGDLKFVQYDPRKTAMKSFPPVYLYANAVKPAPGDCGTVHPKAVVADLGAGTRKLMVAVDAAKADADTLDVMRFDFSGQGKFADVPTVPIKGRGTGQYVAYTVAPTTIQVSIDGRKVPVFVSGTYYSGSDMQAGSGQSDSFTGLSFTTLHLYVGAAAEGSCRFGDKVYGIRVIDGNLNARVGDDLSIALKDGQVTGLRPGQVDGDILAIDTSGEAFHQAAVEAPCGQCVRVDGKWYRVAFSQGGMKAAASEAQVQTGKVLIPHDRWEVALIGPNAMLTINGGREPVDVPAGQYVAANYREMAGKPGDSPSKAMLTAGQQVLYGQKGKVLDVAAGKTTELAIGTPLTAGVAVSQGKGTVQFSALVRDASGSQVDSILNAEGRRAEAPTVSVRDGKDKEIYSGKMQYG